MRLRTALFCAATFGAVLSLVAPASAETTAQQRREACSKEWNAAKEANKVPEGQTWAKFYSECNTRLKAADDAKAGTGAKAADTKAAEPKAAEPKAAAKPAAEESTRQSRMKQCSEEWNAAKAAGKIPTGQTWPKYYSECNARLTGAAPAAAPAATTAAKPAAAPAAPAAAAATTGKARQQQCSEEWQAAKAANKVPAGQTWQKFYSECNARLSGEAPAAAPAAAAKPTAAPAAPATTAPAKPAAAPATAAKPAAAKAEDDEDTGEGVREPTPGQLAARARMKECGAQWRTTKEAGKIPEGQTWPQYWSACNKRLKAAGQ